MMFINLVLSAFIALAAAPPTTSAPAVPRKPYENNTSNTNDVLTVAFPKSYNEARLAFREAADPAVKTLGAKLGAYKIPSKTDPDLTIDHLYIPAAQKSDKLFILTSGIHGTEAYAGHPIELMFLKEVIAKHDDYPFNILIIHGLNPFGFKYFRRANENNIDLNRNFVGPEQFKTENKAYKKLRRMFNPPGPANAMWVSEVQFYLSAFWNKMIRGKKTILAGLSGQYQDSSGPFYGGNTQQAETIFAQFIIKQYGAFAAKIYHVDLHTGFGRKGHLHLIVPEKARDTQSGSYIKVFKNMELNSGDDPDFYPTMGDITYWTWQSFPDKIVIPVTFEMGTMDSQTTMGGVRSLWITVVDNQGFNKGFNSKQSEIISRSNYEELFNPQDRDWQAQVIRQAKDSLDQTLMRFKAL